MSGWLPNAPCTPGTCVAPARSALAVPRAVLRLTAVALVLLAGIALAPLGGRIPAGAVRRWCRALVRAVGVRVRVSGAAASTGGLLLVANHISWLDVPLLAAVRPARMLAKSEIRDWPVAGRLAARAGTLFLHRDRLRTLPGTVARIADALRAGAAVAAFPEGSTWCGRAQGPFRRAVFQAALDAGAAVQPVRIRYRLADGTPATAPAFVGEDTFLASVWRVACARGLVAEGEVLPVLPPGSRPDRRLLARAAQPGRTGEPDSVAGALVARHRITPAAAAAPPAATPREPVATPREPVAVPREPGATPYEPGVAPRELAAARAAAHRRRTSAAVPRDRARGGAAGPTA
ncbi:lysophospholipid acyltransferase family protein [Streptomyces echinoruber]|uniref:lysophospholipid acyltransferase family protein n=1 Tax=Streptomyces echinoruber TaxID=68898 RepID=UPI0036163609